MPRLRLPPLRPPLPNTPTLAAERNLTRGGDGPRTRNLLAAVTALLYTL